MKKLCVIKFLVFLLLFVFVSCENEQDIQSNIDRLNKQRTALYLEDNQLSLSVENKKSELKKIKNEIAEHEKLSQIYISGKIPKYILKIHLRQIHYSLDLEEQAKDAMNAVDFEIPVDKEYYDAVKKGTEIVGDFRLGSLVLNGSFGDWSMTVEDKEIR